MTKSTITRATAIAVSVGLLGGSAVYEGYAKTKATRTGDDNTVLALSRTTSPDDVVVVVNGHEVTKAEVDREIDAMLGGRLDMVPPEQRDGVRAQLATRVTDGVIVKTLLEQAVENEKVAVDQEKVAETMKQIVASLPDGKTIAEYAEASGTTEDAIAEDLAMSLRVEKLIGEKTSFEAPTDAEVTAFYEQNAEMFQVPERAEVRHILVAVAPEADEATRAEAKKKAEGIRDELVAAGGDQFATFASERSDCPSKADGGSLGPVARNDTVPEFEAVVFSQEVGEIGPVVQTPFGYHVVRVEKREPAGKVTLAEVKPFIAERLAQDKQRVAVEKYIEDLRANAEVVYPSNEAA